MSYPGYPPSGHGYPPQGGYNPNAPYPSGQPPQYSPYGPSPPGGAPPAYPGAPPFLAPAGASPFQPPPPGTSPYQPCFTGQGGQEMGRPFFIQSYLSGKVLDIAGGNSGPGAKVIMFPKKSPPASNQMWYMSQEGTIRSKLNDFAIDATKQNEVRMQPYNPKNPKQQWYFQGNRIMNRNSPDEVLDISGDNRNSGATLCLWKYKGSKNQHFYWTSPYQPCFTGQGGQEMGRLFFIRSELSGMVLDIAGGNSGPGAKVIMFPEKSPPASNQMWYMSQEGTIRSKLNDFAIDATKQNEVRMQPYNPKNPKQQWYFQGNGIMNRDSPDEVLDISGENRNSGATLCLWKYKGSKNQRFYCEYV